MSQTAAPLFIRLEDRLALEDLLQSRRTSERVQLRCRIVLLAADGVPNLTIAQRLNVTRPTVLEWRRRFEEEGLAAMVGRIPDQSSTLKARLARIKDLLQEGNPHGGGWNVRSLAQALETSSTTLQRLLEAGGIRLRSPAPPLEPDFLAQVTELAGLYLHPPHHAAAFKVLAQGANRRPQAPLRPGSTAWTFMLHLRSLEALREMEGHSTHFPSNYWRFIGGLEGRGCGPLFLVSDTTLGPDYMRRLNASQPDLQFASLNPGARWLEVMKDWLLPPLQNQGSPNLALADQAMATFLENEGADPFLWWMPGSQDPSPASPALRP